MPAICCLARTAISADIFGHLQDDDTELGPQTDFFTLIGVLD